MFEIDALRIGDDASRWAAAGFAPDGDEVAIGSARISLEGPAAGRGIVGWSLRGPGVGERRPIGDLDGLPTESSNTPAPRGETQPNGVVAIDHVVAFTPDLARTRAALEAAGLDVRRLRDAPTPGGGGHQAFFRLGEVILEVVQAPPGSRLAAAPAGPARRWGMAVGGEARDAPGGHRGARAGEPRDAVQPGRRIITLRREAGLGPAIAFMSPGPGAIG